KRQRLAGPEVELGAVTRADHGAGLVVPRAEADGAVVVRAAILDRVQLAAAVVDADPETVGLHELHLSFGQLRDGSDLEIRQSRGPATRRGAACPSRDGARPSRRRGRGSRT